MTWRRTFEEDLFRLVFPDDEFGPRDRIIVDMSWSPGEDSFAYSSVTYEPGTDADFWIRVEWHPSWTDPREGCPGSRFYLGVVSPPPETRWFHRDEAIDLWMRLMRGD